MNRHKEISNEAKEMLMEIWEELKKTLPPNEDLEQPLRQVDRREWSDHQLNLLYLMDNIIYIELGYTLSHSRNELAAFMGITTPRVRQHEKDAVKKINNLDKETKDDFILAMKEFSKAKADRENDPTIFAPSHKINFSNYKDPNGQTHQESA